MYNVSFNQQTSQPDAMPLTVQSKVIDSFSGVFCVT